MWKSKINEVARTEELSSFQVESSLEGLNAFQSDRFDIVILQLSDLKSATLLGAICELSQIPVLVVSDGASEADRIASLDAGADYFLPGSTSSRELFAYIKAALRQSHKNGKVVSSGSPTLTRRRTFSAVTEPSKRSYDVASRSLLVCGDLTLDPFGRSLRMRGLETTLPSAEYRVLRLLMINEGKLVTSGDILEMIYGEDAPEGTRIAYVYVSRVQSKLRELGCRRGTISRSRAAGWIFKAR